MGPRVPYPTDYDWGDYDPNDLPPGAVVGRPFTVDGNSRMAKSIAYGVQDTYYSQSWKETLDLTISDNITANKRIGAHWLQQAEAEHASIASFARHTLQLMSIGAPSMLLAASQEASLDEIRHAKICYGIASAFLGADFFPGSLEVTDSMSQMNIKDIIQSLVQDGCIEESLSAMEARFQARWTDIPAIKDSLETIAMEEASHAQLAWDTISWIVGRYPEQKQFVIETFREAFEAHWGNLSNYIDTTDSNIFLVQCEGNSMRRFGILTNKDKGLIRKAGVELVIEPAFSEEFKDVSKISRLIMELDFSNIV